MRQGLEPVPARIPPLPGTSQRRDERPPADAAPTPQQPAAMERTAAPAVGGRSFRAREFQLDKESRDYVDSTVHSIRLRTETVFDRSTLVRGILKAVRRSGVDIAARCDSEDDVTEYLLRLLPRRTA